MRVSSKLPPPVMQPFRRLCNKNDGCQGIVKFWLTEERSRAGPDLPLNFENISLSKLQVDKLQAIGVNYDPDTGYLAEVVVDQSTEEGEGEE